MKILASDINWFVPQQRLVQRVKFGTEFVSGKTVGAFYLTEFKFEGILSVLDSIVLIVGTVANLVSKCWNIHKESRGNGKEPELCLLGKELEALVSLLKVDYTKPTATAGASETSTADASNNKSNKKLIYISP